MRSKIAKRKKLGAVCTRCKSPDYDYLGRADSKSCGKHEFRCKSCGDFWQYGSNESIYTKLK